MNSYCMLQLHVSVALEEWVASWCANGALDCTWHKRTVEIAHKGIAS